MTIQPDPQGTAVAGLYAALIEALVETGALSHEALTESLCAMEGTLAAEYPEAIEAWGRLRLRVEKLLGYPNEPEPGTYREDE